MEGAVQLTLGDDPPAPPQLPAWKPPELPEGTGYTAMEAAEVLIPQSDEWRRRETIRRRVQELANPYGLLRVIGERAGAKSKADNRVYALTEVGQLAYASWEEGLAWTPHHLARSSDPDTSQKAARKIRPNKDFHRVVTLFMVARG